MLFCLRPMLLCLENVAYLMDVTPSNPLSPTLHVHVVEQPWFCHPRASSVQLTPWFQPLFWRGGLTQVFWQCYQFPDTFSGTWQSLLGLHKVLPPQVNDKLLAAWSPGGCGRVFAVACTRCKPFFLQCSLSSFTLARDNRTNTYGTHSQRTVTWR